MTTTIINNMKIEEDKTKRLTYRIVDNVDELESSETLLISHKLDKVTIDIWSFRYIKARFSEIKYYAKIYDNGVFVTQTEFNNKNDVLLDAIEFAIRSNLITK